MNRFIRLTFGENFIQEDFLITHIIGEKGIYAPTSDEKITIYHNDLIIAEKISVGLLYKNDSSFEWASYSIPFRYFISAKSVIKIETNKPIINSALSGIVLIGKKETKTIKSFIKGINAGIDYKEKEIFDFSIKPFPNTIFELKNIRAIYRAGDCVYHNNIETESFLEMKSDNEEIIKDRIPLNLICDKPFFVSKELNIQIKNLLYIRGTEAKTIANQIVHPDFAFVFEILK
ncbi:MAG: hypothetical protein NC926_08305 [Candidatus Omnitrophica bacterium]|nr:hypothetical protein [Candidatus Omnitrophota bacterium]